MREEGGPDLHVLSVTWGEAQRIDWGSNSVPPPPGRGMPYTGEPQCRLQRQREQQEEAAQIGPNRLYPLGEALGRGL